MDLLRLFTLLLRHRVLVLVALLLTAGGEVAILYAVPPRYESTAQFVLINTPEGPSAEDVKRDPTLAKVITGNPYLRIPLSVVVDVLAERVSADDVRQQLVKQGADKAYTASATNAIGSGLVVEIVGSGRSSDLAQKTVDLVSKRLLTELRDMQKSEGADDRYLLRALPVSPPTVPVRRITGTARSLIAVAVAGLVLLFALLSIAEAIRGRRVRADPPDLPEAGPPPIQARFQGRSIGRVAGRQSVHAKPGALYGAARGADANTNAADN